MKTILIVEDVEFNLDLLVQLLEDNYTTSPPPTVQPVLHWQSVHALI
jgi:hypothetical protein